MPVMDGYTATREIRKHEQWRELPIIAMTANAMAGDREKVLEAGMTDYIAKPLDPEVMFAVIARWVRPSEPVAPRDAQAASPADASLSTDLDLPGIDQQAGLTICMGNRALYRKMLVRFWHGQHDFAHTFAAALRDPDADSATRAAHTLKGVAGNIGARAVQAAADRLEQACGQRAHSQQIDDALKEVLDQLARLLPALKVLADDKPADLARTDEPASAAAIDPQVMASQLAALRALLVDGDAGAVQALEALQAATMGGPWAHQLKEVANAIEAFDFERALVALDRMEWPAGTGAVADLAASVGVADQTA